MVLAFYTIRTTRCVDTKPHLKVVGVWAEKSESDGRHRLRRHSQLTSFTVNIITNDARTKNICRYHISSGKH
jgi:hypothetical protein